MKSKPPLLFPIRRLAGFTALIFAVFAQVQASRADTVINATGFSYTGSTQTYTVPSGTDYIVVKAWGAGGATGLGPTGGAGGFVSATFTLTPGQTITLWVGGGGTCGASTWPSASGGGWNGGGNATDVAGGGGGATKVQTPAGTVYAGGGGGSGWVGSTGAGSAGGSANDQNASDAASTASAGGGGGGTTSGVGAGGTGSFGEDGQNGSSGQGGNGGTDGGPSASYVDDAAAGGGGGGGYYGGGGGGTGDRSSGSAGGGGGSSLVTGSPTSVSYAGGSGATPGGTSDSYYPGGGKAYGATANFSAGGHGYAVVIAYQQAGPPVVNSSLSTITRAQGQGGTYTITATQSPTSFGASNLPPGVSVNSTTGVISGNPTTAGSYNSIISATNSSGTGTATLPWVINAAQIVTNASITPSAIALGDSVQVYRDGTANFVVAWSEMTIWKPGGAGDALGSAPLGGPSSYTPNAGPGTYTFQFRLIDTYYNYAEQWGTFTVKLPTPTGLSSTSTLSYSASLAWNTVSGATQYHIYRNGSYLGTTTGTTFSVTGLNASTAYTFTVQAQDNAGNYSFQSSTLNVTTAASFILFSPL